MYRNLDQVNWAAATHAYGSAADVPTHLRALASDDARARSEALVELAQSINHQGSVYAASELALPFLVALLADAQHPERSDVAGLVSRILGASNTTAVHYSRVIINPFTRQVMPKPADVAERIAREDALLERIRRAGASAVSDLISLLGSEDANLRVDIARALRHYTSSKEVVVALEAALERETNPRARDALTAALK